MKTLDYDVFKDCPDWVVCAAVESGGDAWFYPCDTEVIITTWASNGKSIDQIDGEFDSSNWRESKIYRKDAEIRVGDMVRLNDYNKTEYDKYPLGFTVGMGHQVGKEALVNKRGSKDGVEYAQMEHIECAWDIRTLTKLTNAEQKPKPIEYQVNDWVIANEIHWGGCGSCVVKIVSLNYDGQDDYVSVDNDKHTTCCLAKQNIVRRATPEEIAIAKGEDVQYLADQWIKMKEQHAGLSGMVHKIYISDNPNYEIFSEGGEISIHHCHIERHAHESEISIAKGEDIIRIEMGDVVKGPWCDWMVGVKVNHTEHGDALITERSDNDRFKTDCPKYSNCMFYEHRSERFRDSVTYAETFTVRNGKVERGLQGKELGRAEEDTVDWDDSGLDEHQRLAALNLSANAGGRYDVTYDELEGQYDYSRMMGHPKATAGAIYCSAYAIDMGAATPYEEPMETVTFKKYADGPVEDYETRPRSERILHMLQRVQSPAEIVRQLYGES